MSFLNILRGKVSISFTGLAVIGLCLYILYQPALHFYGEMGSTEGHANLTEATSGHVEFGKGGATYYPDSNAIPLELTEFPLRAASDIPLQGGAIQQLGSKVLILDRLGSSWLFSKGKIAPSGLPKLPLDAEAFSKQSPFPLDATTLQAHDIRVNPRDGRVYASFEAFDSSLGATRFAIARSAEWPGPHPHWEVIFQGPLLYSKEFYAGRSGGGQMAFKNNALIFSVGDYNLDTGSFPAAQDATSLYGKIYSMDLATGKIELLSSGHRVALGLTVAPDGEIWETENGPRGGDELNRIVKGRNYGWPYDTLGQNYFANGYTYGYQKPGSIGKLVLDTLGRKQTFESPVYAWIPAVAVSQILRLDGFDPAWDGDFLIGSLKGQSLYRIRIKDGRVLFCEPIWIGHRVRDMVQDANAIIVWTDDGTLLRLTRRSQNPQPGASAANQENPVAECANCHLMTGHRSTSFGPNLAGIYGRRIASAEYQYYSPALKALDGGTWDEGALRQYIRNAPSIAPGTTMPALSIPDDRLNRIVAALKASPPQK
jgi:cytochrome c2